MIMANNNNILSSQTNSIFTAQENAKNMLTKLIKKIT